MFDAPALMTTLVFFEPIVPGCLRRRARREQRRAAQSFSLFVCFHNARESRRGRSTERQTLLVRFNYSEIQLLFSTKTSALGDSVRTVCGQCATFPVSFSVERAIFAFVCTDNIHRGSRRTQWPGEDRDHVSIGLGRRPLAFSDVASGGV